MRILIDTNIIIPLEDSSGILKASFSQFIRLSLENRHTILIHPSSIEDIHRDRDRSRKQSMLSRIQKYPILEETDTFTPEELQAYDISENSDNDKVDNAILSSVYNKAVHLLVTEDRGIHKKAAKLGVSDSVLYLQQAVDVLTRLHPQEQEVFHPNLKNIYVHETSLDDPFYNSLREDYLEFDSWFNKISAEGRKAWANFDNTRQTLNAILIYKPEEGEIITSDSRGLPGKSIKISTFKVGEQVRGRKIGELLFKSVFDFAYMNNYSWVYLTIHPEKHEFLKDLCLDLGFENYGIDIHGRDQVYRKSIANPPSPLDTQEPFDFYRKYSPAVICDNVNKYIIPIQPRYHDILFPDNTKQRSLFGASEPAGNTIKKAYLSHAQLQSMSPGDIVLFYRSGDRKALTTLAIVEDYFTSGSSDEIVAKVAKRTVYSFVEIQRMAERPTKVLLFRQVIHFRQDIPIRWLHENSIVSGSIQSIRRIGNEAFERIMDEAQATNCIAVY
jgi:predicted nucleic acid-binding protein